MRVLLLSLSLLLLGPASALALNYEIAGIKIDLPGNAPREIVQFSFGGEAPMLREKDALLSWLKT